MHANPKRLIEVDLPIRRISAHARREKSIRHGHISTLHMWWARRPLAACRAAASAALWIDPADPLCPETFRVDAKAAVLELIGNNASALTAEGHKALRRFHENASLLDDPLELRAALLEFIAEAARWENTSNRSVIALLQRVTASATRAITPAKNRPFAVDTFAGGGAIPIEASRVGADVFASDINPLPILLNKVAIQYIPQYGQALADEVRELGARIARSVYASLRDLYPASSPGETVLAYLWSRTITCEGPGCGASVPLFRSKTLVASTKRKLVLNLIPAAQNVDVQLIENSGNGWKDVETGADAEPPASLEGTVKRGSGTCPCCGYTTPVKRVRVQLLERRGGTEDAKLLCVVTTNAGQSGRAYRRPTALDLEAFAHSVNLAKHAREHAGAGISEIPNEPIPITEIRRVSVPLYGMTDWGRVFTPRQNVALAAYVKAIHAECKTSRIPERVVLELMALALGRIADSCSSLTRWLPTREISAGTFGRQALGMVWDYCEVNPIAGASGGWDGAVEWIAKVCEHQATTITNPGQVQQCSATAHALPDDIADLWMVDPPYYDAVPYAHLSDFFYVWLRRVLNEVDASLFSLSETPKSEEIVVDRPHKLSKSTKTVAFYQKMLTEAFSEGRRITQPNGIGVIVFASKTTASWEAILSAIVQSGWVITGSWPIDTEREARVAAQGQARLASSVHLVVRPRESSSGQLVNDDVGEWRDVIGELPGRVHTWMSRLAAEGVVGADAIFACLGPALEIFSRYSRVERANGEAVELKEYLEAVWSAVAKAALESVFKDADVSGFEPDARLTAMWLWTLQGGAKDEAVNEDDSEEGEDDEPDDSPSPKTGRSGGFNLEFDAARKIAQGLGVDLHSLGSLVEIKAETARLLSVAERFGLALTPKRESKAAPQQEALFTAAEDSNHSIANSAGPSIEAGKTRLDRLHQSMMLFAQGRLEAMKRLIVESGSANDVGFWRLADALSALYPASTDEKRWVDGLLSRKKGLGF